MRLSRLLLLAAAIATALVVRVALAEARYDHSIPGPGDVVATSPARVDLFTRRPTSTTPGDTQMTVIDRDQHRVDLGNVVVDADNHQHFSVGVRPELPRGRYIVTFKTLDEMNHEHDGGQFAFYVGGQPTSADGAADASLSLTTVTGDVSLQGYRRGFVEGGLALIVGAPVAWFYLMRRRRDRRAERSGTEGPPRP